MTSVDHLWALFGQLRELSSQMGQPYLWGGQEADVIKRVRNDYAAMVAIHNLLRAQIDALDMLREADEALARAPL